MRDVLALPPARVLLLAAHERLRADAHAHDRMSGVHRPGHLQDRDPVTRHLACRIAPTLGEDDDARSEEEPRGDAHDHAACQLVAGEKRHDEHAAEERDEARLRVGEVEAEREQAEHWKANRGSYPSEPEHGEEHDDPEDEVAAVDARVLEDRRHPEERRVGVRELDVLLGKDLRVRPGLVDADRSEERGHGHERGRERAPRPVPRPCERQDREQHREREVEEDELDRPRAQVFGPEQRDP